MSIHGAWEDLPSDVMDYCYDADMEADVHLSTIDPAPSIIRAISKRVSTRNCLGKLAKGFTDREVAVDLAPDYDMTEENSLKGVAPLAPLDVAAKRTRNSGQEDPTRLWQQREISYLFALRDCTTALSEFLEGTEIGNSTTEKEIERMEEHRGQVCGWNEEAVNLENEEGEEQNENVQENQNGKENIE
ncbi:hypothetical protein FPQ18DRAFT_406070 [Pyronema domesticum]|nr:hypothetical protein FPQ18DRAFT_406070 [Pyronema domesticum]